MSTPLYTSPASVGPASLAQQANQRKLIVEVGSWKGCTARAMADNTSGIVYAVDTWLGDGDWQHIKEIAEHPEGWMFETFQNNMSGLSNVRPIRKSSLEAAEYLGNLGFRADMIFFDAEHGYESVKADILAWRPLLSPSGLLCGHDRQWDGVARAIDELFPGHKAGSGAIWYAA